MRTRRASPRRPEVAGEADFERAVVRIAHQYGWCGHHNKRSEGSVWGVHVFGRDDHTDALGWPDWIFWHPRRGRFIVRELKVPPNVLSRHQKRCLADLQAAGVDAGVWWPSDWAEIVETFAGGD